MKAIRPFHGVALLLIFVIAACTKEEDNNTTFPFLVFKSGTGYISNGAYVPQGAVMKFGISGSGNGSAITYFRVTRQTTTETITELDRGIYIPVGGLDTTLTYYKSGSESEIWTFLMMNENRDTASIRLTVYKSEGSAWNEIYHYTGIKLSYPGNTDNPHYLDAMNGLTYDFSTVNGFEQDIDLAAIFYFTSGKSSPTLTCPAYNNAIAYYPEFESWAVRNNTTYDYKTSDNDLIPPGVFDASTNDSLLINGYNPQYVSGWCKFCYTGKIIPFRNAKGKYGMIKVIHADETENGYIEIELKIQK